VTASRRLLVSIPSPSVLFDRCQSPAETPLGARIVGDIEVDVKKGSTPFRALISGPPTTCFRRPRPSELAADAGSAGVGHRGIESKQPDRNHHDLRSRPDFDRKGTVALIAEVLESHDLTAPSQDGWAVDYRIRRNDGEELHAEVRCWEKAHAAAERSSNSDALAAIADRGIATALEYAEQVDSPATRGAVLISIWFDLGDHGNLRRRVSYERH
jgi:hypothetical protein